MARYPMLPDSPSPTDGQTLVYSNALKRWVPGAAAGGVSSWNDLTDKPATFPPSTHSHTIAQITSLQAELDAKAAQSHTHTIGQVTGLQAALDSKTSTSHHHDARYIRTVNGAGPDGNGNVVVEATGGAGDWAGLNTVGVGRAVFIPAGGSVPAGTPDYTIIVELAE